MFQQVPDLFRASPEAFRGEAFRGDPLGKRISWSAATLVQGSRASTPNLKCGLVSVFSAPICIQFYQTPVSLRYTSLKPLGEESKGRGNLSTMGTNSLQQPVACLQTLISQRDHDIEPLEMRVRIVLHGEIEQPFVPHNLRSSNRLIGRQRRVQHVVWFSEEQQASNEAQQQIAAGKLCTQVGGSESLYVLTKGCKLLKGLSRE